MGVSHELDPASGGVDDAPQSRRHAVGRLRHGDVVTTTPIGLDPPDEEVLQTGQTANHRRDVKHSLDAIAARYANRWAVERPGDCPNCPVEVGVGKVAMMAPGCMKG